MFPFTWHVIALISVRSEFINLTHSIRFSKSDDDKHTLKSRGPLLRLFFFARGENSQVKKKSQSNIDTIQWNSKMIVSLPIETMNNKHAFASFQAFYFRNHPKPIWFAISFLYLFFSLYRSIVFATQLLNATIRRWYWRHWLQWALVLIVHRKRKSRRFWTLVWHQRPSSMPIPRNPLRISTLPPKRMWRSWRWTVNLKCGKSPNISRMQGKSIE